MGYNFLLQRLKAVICPEAILVIDFSVSVDERFLQFCQDMPSILTSSTLHTKNLPFEYRALEVVLTYYVCFLRGNLVNLRLPQFLNIRFKLGLIFQMNSMTDEILQMEPDIHNLLQRLTDPTNMAVDRSLVHVLLQMNAKYA